jgi:uncharacterized membrane protein YdjX (TVP38/TMEM64 family)
LTASASPGVRGRGTHFLFLLAVAAIAWAIWSYAAGGIIHVVATGAADHASYARLREHVERWGALAPVIYVCAVVVEVLVAPIPGTLLYAPGGVLFGGFLGGSLSLLGNVIGAAIACVLGGAIGRRLLWARVDPEKVKPYADLLQRRAVWVVMLLRVNPLTSSDLVSYAAGAAGVPPWKVAAGTAVGMAPLCFAQAYLAEQLFTRLSLPVLIAVGMALLLAVVAVLFYRKRRSPVPPAPTDLGR